MAVVKKLIKDVWLHGQGSTFTAKICRCPTDGRLQEFNVSLKQWSPLTDSDRLVSDLSKLLGMIDMGEGAEKPCKAYTPEQRGLLVASSASVSAVKAVCDIMSKPHKEFDASKLAVHQPVGKETTKHFKGSSLSQHFLNLTPGIDKLKQQWGGLQSSLKIGIKHCPTQDCVTVGLLRLV
ncbi:hypothetical protein ABBQ38_001157 [Trebouxia sp. C0009 RCD-2024]